MAHIVVVGSTNTDMTVQVPHLPEPGETVLGGEFYMSGGGKGANQAVAAARTDGKVIFVGRTGSDLFARDTRTRLGQENIDLTYLLTSDETASGVALIVVDTDGENAISVAPGANSELTPSDVELAEDTIAQADVLVTQLEIPLETVQRSLQIASKHGVRTILDPAPAQDLPTDILQHVSILTPNAAEAATLTDVTDFSRGRLDTIADQLQKSGVETVLITLGKDGLFVAATDRRYHVEGRPVDAVDSTAAGDVFAGALAAALSEGQSLDSAVRFANVAASLSVETGGAQPSAPNRNRVETAQNDDS